MFFTYNITDKKLLLKTARSLFPDIQISKSCEMSLHKKKKNLSKKLERLSIFENVVDMMNIEKCGSICCDL